MQAPSPREDGASPPIYTTETILDDGESDRLRGRSGLRGDAACFYKSRCNAKRAGGREGEAKTFWSRQDSELPRSPRKQSSGASRAKATSVGRNDSRQEIRKKNSCTGKTRDTGFAVAKQTFPCFRYETPCFLYAPGY